RDLPFDLSTPRRANSCFAGVLAVWTCLHAWHEGTPVSARLRAPPEPLLAALVDLLLPERHRLLERVDRVLARRQRVVAVRRRDGDRDARLADLDPADPVVDRDRPELVPLLELGGDLGHHLLGHLGVGLVLEIEDGPAARFPANRAEERRDGAGALVGDLLDDRLEREPLFGDAERAARDGRDQRHLVAVGELLLALGIPAVDRVEQPVRLVAEPERGPDLAHPRDAL